MVDVVIVISAVVVVAVLIVMISVVVVVAAVVVVLEVVLLVEVVTVAVRALACAEAVIDTFVKVLTVDIRVDGSIIESGAAVDLLMDVMAAIILGVRTNIGVSMLVDLNVNAFAGVMTAFGFAMPGPPEEFRCCWAAFDCRPMAALNCDHVLQA